MHELNNHRLTHIMIFLRDGQLLGYNDESSLFSDHNDSIDRLKRIALGLGEQTEISIFLDVFNGFVSKTLHGLKRKVCDIRCRFLKFDRSGRINRIDRKFRAHDGNVRNSAAHFCCKQRLSPRSKPAKPRALGTVKSSTIRLCSALSELFSSFFAYARAT